MKKTILKSLALLLFIAIIGSCSNEENIDSSASKSNLAARASVWDGPIGVYKGKNKYQITADTSVIIADFENTLEASGNKTTLQTLDIVKKAAVNDDTSEAYMLVASDNAGTSIGVMLLIKSNNFYFDGGGSGGGTTTICRGCATGCNLSYLLVDGKKFPYCNENGCGEYCTKSEVSIK